jgi:hypothetical protein
MDLPEPSGPGHGGVGHVVLQRRPDPLDRVVVRAVAGAVQQLQAGMLVRVGGDLAGVVDGVVIADHRDHRSLRERLEHLVKRGDEVRRAAAAQPVYPAPGADLDRAEHGDLPVRARGEDLRARAAQRPAGPHMRQQVQVRLVLGEHHRPGRSSGARWRDGSPAAPRSARLVNRAPTAAPSLPGWPAATGRADHIAAARSRRLDLWRTR